MMKYTGWGSLIGIFPAIGDAFDLLLALLVIRTASEASLPPLILARMLFNVLFDFIIGLVPLIGDLMDMAYKCNTRNAILLEEVLRARGQRNLEQQGRTNVDDPSLGEVVYEDGTVEADGSRTVLGVGRSGERVGDLEAQRGGLGLGGTAPVTVAGTEHGGSLQKPAKSKKRDKGGKKQKSSGHQRIYSQETGETYMS